MRSLPIFGLGLAFALAGLALFVFTLRKPATSAEDKPAKLRAGTVSAKRAARAGEQAQAAQQTETNKLRIAAAILVALGAAVMIIS